jgi:SAM-dependent methyltransferase
VTGGAGWWDEAFRADYRQVYPHRDEASARRELDFVRSIGIGGRLLDVACGFGRHVQAALESGLEAYGVDRSIELVSEARVLARGESVRGRLACADARALPFRDASFDTCTLFFSSFGYFGERDDRRVMAELARVLRPGGRSFLDLMNPPRGRATLVPRSRVERGDLDIEEQRELADGGRRVTKLVRLSGGGRERSWREDVRLYERGEIESLFELAGLRAAGAFGDFDGRALSDDAPRLLLLAHKRV